MAKHIVVYHDHCNDGFGAAFVAWQHLTAAGHEVELVPASYGDLPPSEQADDAHLHILDFSYPPEIIIEACKYHETVTWLDHHKTAIDAFAAEGYMSGQAATPENLRYWLTDTMSGAMLAHCWYNEDWKLQNVPRFIQLIDDRDRWQFKYPETKAFHAGMSLFPRDIEMWKYLTLSEVVPATVEKGAAVLTYLDNLYEQLMETAYEITIDGNKGLAINGPGQFASDLGNKLAIKSGTFGAVYASDGRGYKFSLRSCGAYDVSAIAKKFGGGGHKNAAGFTLVSPQGIDGTATGCSLWSSVDEFTSYCHDAGGENNE